MKSVEGKGCCREHSDTLVAYRTVLDCFAPMYTRKPLFSFYTGKAVSINCVTTWQPALSRKPQNQITYWIICSFSPFGWHFSTFVCCFHLILDLWVDRDPGCWTGLSPAPSCGAAVIARVALWVLPLWVTSTDTARKERSDGNNTVTQVRTPFVLRMGLIPKTKDTDITGFRSAPKCSSCFQAAPAFSMAFRSLTGSRGKHTTRSHSCSWAHSCAMEAAQINSAFN